jgi:hypothetical protein
MRFNNKSISREISIATEKADELLNIDSVAMNEVWLKRDWKFTNINSSKIVEFLTRPRLTVDVYTYKPFNPWTKAIAYFDGKAIHFNIRKLPNLSVAEITGTLLHEYAHYCGFTHGNNFKTKEKCLYSVPYFLSENVHKWL